MTKLRKLQLVELDMLQELDRICRKHGLMYYLYAGTLLGAVRHKGFIPWDDDIDVQMPLEDYRQFCYICQTELDSQKYFLQTMDTDFNYKYIFAKLRRQGTLYIRKGQEHMNYHHGICIDIFPLYPAPGNALLRRLLIFIVARCKTIMWSPIGAISEVRPFLRKIYRILSKIPFCFPRRIIEGLVAQCSGKYKICLGNPKLEMNIPDSKTFKQIQIHESIELEFEGLNFLTPANYDIILRYFYDDYMQLPPEHERSGHHYATIIDFGNALKSIAMPEGNA